MRLWCSLVIVVGVASTISDDKLAAIEKRLAKLEARERARRGPSECATSFPVLDDAATYNGCNRNAFRNSFHDWPGNKTVETCQAGKFLMYNTSTTSTNGLFDLALKVVYSPQDPREAGCTYHFTCAYTADEPHVGTCTLLYQVPVTRAGMGPALLTVRFKNVTRAVDGVCRPSAATIIGNYLYDSRQPAAGTYTFRMPSSNRSFAFEDVI